MKRSKQNGKLVRVAPIARQSGSTKSTRGAAAGQFGRQRPTNLKEASPFRPRASYLGAGASILLWLHCAFAAAARPDCKQSGPPRQLALAFFYGALALAICGSANAAELRFREHALVAGGVVTLGDVAEIRAENTREVASLAAVSLFPAPIEGSNAYAEEILETLELRGVAVRDLVVSGSRVVAIRPAAAGKLSIRPANGATSGVSTVSAYAAFEAALAERDARLAKAAMTVQPKTTIKNDAALEPVVRRGDAVKATVVAGTVVVTTRGVAETDGAIGQLVTIRSPDRKRTFDGVVVGPQAVRVGGASR
jgi:flagella basal body P-ring formation protein FlgA